MQKLGTLGRLLFMLALQLQYTPLLLKILN